jgi:magnesium-transporting ATPase (P-type)
MLAIPTVWDIAKRNTVKRLNSSNVHVQNIDSIEDASSIDYLCIQSIGILDDEDKLDEYRASIKRLQDMGIKVILATGIKAEDAK